MAGAYLGSEVAARMGLVEERSYRGGCHCGAVRFEVKARLDRVLDCNCSICSKKGFLHVIVDKDAFQLLTPEDALASYSFGTHTAKHLFCKRCGIASFYVPRSHPGGYSVNARCLDDVDLSALPVVPFDGSRWDASIATLHPGRAP